MQDNTNPKDIKEILDDISSEEKENSVELATEFVFESGIAPEPETGLVFDDSGEEEEPEETVPAPDVKFEAAEASEERNPEFLMPAKFEVNKKYDTQIKIEEAPKIFTTYVPTFTEASENYRMINDPRPKVNVPKITSVSATDEYEDDIDPTAEIDEGVKLDASTPLKASDEYRDNSESVSKVFKFAENEIPNNEEYSETEEAFEEIVEESEEIEEFEELEEVERKYVIPDPETALDTIPERTVSNVLTERMILVDAPIDVGERIEEDKRKKHGEYTSYAKRDTFKDKYLDIIMSVRVRFYVAAAIALLLLVMEISFAAGVNLPELFNIVTIPGAVALLDLQFALCLFLLSLPETIKGVRLLIKKQVTPELYIPIAFLVLIAYTTVAAIYSPKSYPVFGMLFAVAAIAAIGSTYHKLSADFEAFKLVSSNGEKRIIDNKYTRSLECENAALDGAVEEHKSKISRFFRTVFVSDFFAMAERGAENTVNLLIMLGSSFGFAVITGAVAYFIPGGMINAFAAFAMVFMTAFPIVSITAQKLPYYHASKEAVSEKSAVIGEAALFDYADIDVITFDDLEVFGEEDVTLQRIMLYGQSENLSKALRQMSALFIKVGGPLDVLFSSSLDRKCPPASNVEIFEDGVLGEIDGVAVAGGNLKFMHENGIFVPDESIQAESVSATTRIMYAAENGNVYAKFYIRYSFSEEFSMILPMLDDEKVKVLVYTRNPGIDNELMKNLTAGVDKIRVMRRTLPLSHDNALYNKVTAPFVTVGDKMNAINTILTAKKYANLESTLVVSERIAMAAGGALTFILAVGGMLIVPPIALAVWQAGLCGAVHIISRRTFPKKIKKGK